LPTVEKYNNVVLTGLSARSVLERMSGIQMLDVTIPVTDGRELSMRRCTHYEKFHQLMPAQPLSEIRNRTQVVKTH
jgi:hypothetical protein